MTRMTFRRSAEDLPVPLASADSSTTSLPLLLGTGGSLRPSHAATNLMLRTRGLVTDRLMFKGSEAGSGRKTTDDVLVLTSVRYDAQIALRTKLPDRTIDSALHTHN